MIDIKIIAALDKSSRAIGKNGKIPWAINEEIEHFKQETVGSPVILGRKTFESIVYQIGTPLSERENIVLTRDGELDVEFPSVISVSTKEEAIGVAKERNNEVYVAGGQSIYEQFLDEADELILSYVDEDVEDADSFFPAFDHSEWEITERQMNNKFNVVRRVRE